MHAIDPKARRILYEADWSSQGWKRPRQEPSPEDLAYAKAAGLMFDRTVFTHDSAITRIVASQRLVDLRTVADSFVASLSSRAVHLRPALASWFAVHAISPHAAVGDGVCATCRQFLEFEHDFSSTSFARLKWGSIPSFFAVDHAFTLESCAIEGHPPPTADDRGILLRLLETAGTMPPDARARDLEVAVKPVLRSNISERQMLIETLFMCGVLVPTHFSDADRAGVPLRTDWGDAAALWRGADGIDHARAREIFGIAAD